MSEDKMPTEVTSSPVSLRGLFALVFAGIGAGTEGIIAGEGAPWWWMPLAALGGLVLWWAIYATLVAWEEAEREDGENDPGSRTLARLRRAWERQKKIDDEKNVDGENK